MVMQVHHSSTVSAPQECYLLFSGTYGGLSGSSSSTGWMWAYREVSCRSKGRFREEGRDSYSWLEWKDSEREGRVGL